MSTEEVCIHQPWGLIHHSAFPEQKKYRELSLVSLKAVIFHLEIGSDFSISNPFLKSPSQEWAVLRGSSSNSREFRIRNQGLLAFTGNVLLLRKAKQTESTLTVGMCLFPYRFWWPWNDLGVDLCWKRHPLSLVPSESPNNQTLNVSPWLGSILSALKVLTHLKFTALPWGR